MRGKLAEDDPTTKSHLDPFKCSKRYFETFKVRREIRNLKLHREVAATDTQATQKYQRKFLNSIITGSYAAN